MNDGILVPILAAVVLTAVVTLASTTLADVRQAKEDALDVVDVVKTLNARLGGFDDLEASATRRAAEIEFRYRWAKISFALSLAAFAAGIYSLLA